MSESTHQLEPPALSSDETQPAVEFTFCAPREDVIAQIINKIAEDSEANGTELCKLRPKDFAERVLNGKDVAIDDGDWVQPVFCEEGGVWRLSRLEVLYRVRHARSVPYPAFVDFVHAATDVSESPDPALSNAFAEFAAASIRRVDARITEFERENDQALSRANILTSINVTTKQLEGILKVDLKNLKLLALEESEYDFGCGGLSELHEQAWGKFGAFALDDIKPTLGDLEDAFNEEPAHPFQYASPETPQGFAYKPLVAKYNHDLKFARGFIDDFKRAQVKSDAAQGEFKLSEDFCLYLIGVGYAPFARDSMAAWREANPEANKRIRKMGVDLIREALEVGMTICLEVSFMDKEVQWLYDELPNLRGKLQKQGGLSGSAAVPISMIGKVILDAARESSVKDREEAQSARDRAEAQSFSVSTGPT